MKIQGGLKKMVLVIVVLSFFSAISNAENLYPRSEGEHRERLMRKSSEIGPVVDIKRQEKLEVAYPASLIKNLIEEGYFENELKQLKQNKPLWFEIGQNTKMYILLLEVCGLLPKQLQYEVSYKALEFNGLDSLIEIIEKGLAVAIPDCRPLRAKLDRIQSSH